MALVKWASAVKQNRTNSLGFTPQATLRAVAALTASYVASSHVSVVGFRRVTLLLAYVFSSATSIEWYVEFSHDGTTWYRVVNKSASAGTVTNVAANDTMTVTESLNFCDTFETQGAYMRVSVKRTNGAAGDTLGIIAQGMTQ